MKATTFVFSAAMQEPRSLMARTSLEGLGRRRVATLGHQERVIRVAN